MYEVTRYKEYFKKSKGECEGTYEMTCDERQEAKKAGKRISFITELQDAKDYEERERLKRNGLCPHCHIYLPASGECDICGYTKPQATGDITPSFQARLAKVKEGFTK